MIPVSPVVPGMEEFETLVAKDQPEYLPLPAFIGGAPHYPVVSRWRLDERERQKIADGGDVVLTVCTFQRGIPPVILEVIGQQDTPFGFTPHGV